MSGDGKMLPPLSSEGRKTLLGKRRVLRPHIPTMGETVSTSKLLLVLLSAIYLFRLSYASILCLERAFLFVFSIVWVLTFSYLTGYSSFMKLGLSSRRVPTLNVDFVNCGVNERNRLVTTVVHEGSPACHENHMLEIQYAVALRLQNLARTNRLGLPS